MRAALVNEAAVLSVLHHALSRDTFAFDAAIHSASAHADSLVLVCEVSESIAGYLCLGAPTAGLYLGLDRSNQEEDPNQSREWALRAIGVAPQFRRTSVATDLWRAALAEIPGSVSVVTSRTHSDLTSAIAWFDARGFVADPTTATTATTTTPAGASGELTFRADVVALRAHLADAAS